MLQKNAIRYVTPEDFDLVLSTVSSRGFPSWFSLALRILFATGCRAAEVVGSKGREGREEEEGGSYRISRMKPHHGIRARDIMPNFRLFVAGKNTTPKGRTTALKPRIVLCADRAIHQEIAALGAQRRDKDANLFLPRSRDGIRMLRVEMIRLRPMLPDRLSDFSPRWLRHSHAIAAMRAGVDLVSIQRQLGHESLTTTANTYMRYAGLDDKRYLAAFGGDLPPLAVRSCPSCGFAWSEDTKSGALNLTSRMGVALRRSR
ncbi:MAG: site-specific integrase [Candidatus Thermoplasmatota archaeon]